MKFLFKKRNAAEADGQLRDIGVRLMTRIKEQQSRWAVWMQAKSEQLSIRTKWWLLLLFCVLSSLACIYLMSAAFSVKPAAIIHAERIKSPVRLAPLRKSNPVISKTEYQKLRVFKIYMDSLARAPGEREQYERIMRQHPGLLDSIETLEQIYHSQLNQK